MKIQFKNKGLTVFESSLYRTTSTIISLDDVVLIVDPTWLPSEIECIQKYITQHHGDKKQYLVFTHSDYDHIIGYEAFKNATTIASQNFTQHPNKAKVLQQIKDFDNEYYITRNYPISYPVIDLAIESSVQQVFIAETPIYFYQTRGHTNDGIFIVIPEKKIWVVGDYLSNIEIPWIGDGVTDYQNTIALAEFIYHKYPRIDTLVPGHGDTTRNRLEILDRIKNDFRYLELLNSSNEKVTNITDPIQQHLHNYEYRKEMEKIHSKNNHGLINTLLNK